MASSGTERADEEAALPSAAAATDEVDSGWSDAPKPIEAAPAKVAEEGKSAADTAPIEQSAPPEEASTAAVEPAPAPAREQTPPPAEEHGALVEAKPPPAEEKPLPVEEMAPKEPPVAPVPPPASGAEPGLFASLWKARPSGAWLAIGGGTLVLTLIAGILIGRGSRSEPERVAVSKKPPPPSPEQPIATKETSPPTAASSAVIPGALTEPPPSASPAATKHAPAEFNAQAAKLAIDRVVPRLKGCKQPGEPPGQATVTVTFAHTGRVSDARVTTTRYAGTRTGNCIAQRLHEARVPEFTGKPMTVKRGITVR